MANLQHAKQDTEVRSNERMQALISSDNSCREFEGARFSHLTLTITRATPPDMPGKMSSIRLCTLGVCSTSIKVWLIVLAGIFEVCKRW